MHEFLRWTMRFQRCFTQLILGRGRLQTCFLCCPGRPGGRQGSAICRTSVTLALLPGQRLPSLCSPQGPRTACWAGPSRPCPDQATSFLSPWWRPLLTTLARHPWGGFRKRTGMNVPCRHRLPVLGPVSRPRHPRSGPRWVDGGMEGQETGWKGTQMNSEGTCGCCREGAAWEGGWVRKQQGGGRTEGGQEE